MSLTRRHFILDRKNPRMDEVLAGAIAALRAASDREPTECVIQTYEPKAGPQRLRGLMARVRDIVRHKLGDMTVPEHRVEQVVDDLKAMTVNGAHLWPRESDSTPDHFTGEVLYRAKSRRDLTVQEIAGLIRWLDAYMAENNIPSNAPTERWEDDAA